MVANSNLTTTLISYRSISGGKFHENFQRKVLKSIHMLTDFQRNDFEAVFIVKKIHEVQNIGFTGKFLLPPILLCAPGCLRSLWRFLRPF